MRKLVLNFNLIACVALLLFTSCLGDSETIVKADNEFVYIGESQGSLYAMTRYGKVRNKSLEEDQKVFAGDCAFASFKLNGDNFFLDGYSADYLNIDSKKIYRKRDQIIPDVLVNVDTISLGENGLAVYGLGAILNSSRDEWGDRWHVSYSYKRKEGESTPKFKLLYDSRPEMQLGFDGQNLPKGHFILDIRLERAGTATGVLETVENTNIVMDLRNLRTLFQGEKDEKDEVTFWFRYFQEDKDGIAKIFKVKTNNGLYYPQ